MHVIAKNLIFDLGGVIIDLSIDKTVLAICALSGFTPEQVRHAYRANPEFYAYERGEISDGEFRTALRQIFSFTAPDHQIDKAWNAMLIDLPSAKLTLLRELHQRFTVAVLSNTNNIHLNFVNQHMLPKVSSAVSLDDYFHVSYYSHLVGKRKPEPEIFEQVLSENSFHPAETLFLDDNKENIEAAKALGIQTCCVDNPDDVLDYFKTL